MIGRVATFEFTTPVQVLLNVSKKSRNSGTKRGQNLLANLPAIQASSIEYL